jgi:hypothetical protein
MGPQMASTAEPVLTDAVEIGAMLKNKSNNYLRKNKKFIWTQIFFFPVEGWQ